MEPYVTTIFRADRPPNVIVLAGPNGAGKSAAAPSLLRGKLAVPHFVNADTIAQGLAAYAPETAAFQAGRVMIARLKELASSRVSFAFETTLASRTFAHWLRELIADGYCFHLVFLWLPSVELAIARVAERVREGGHDVPEETIRRRYAAGSQNFWRLYRPLTTTWRVYDNSVSSGMRLLASGRGEITLNVYDPLGWTRFEIEAGHDE
jgi:predicted ABC-type ATPase